MKYEYYFHFHRNRKLRIRITANSYAEASQYVGAQYRLICINKPN